MCVDRRRQFFGRLPDIEEFSRCCYFVLSSHSVSWNGANEEHLRSLLFHEDRPPYLQGNVYVFCSLTLFLLYTESSLDGSVWTKKVWFISSNVTTPADQKITLFERTSYTS
ncbi:hypothetical protein BD410DRAFT_789772 [Rickenella mellea]|uniref:Uncharacterized protein n=1 Tax=Rickenella mellea TaxID=50990 RepID=A0A4Y7Q394_9AGAM|nr:hypothetical protein BD410DRAFT_789772 [Rickenella mellea]